MRSLSLAHTQACVWVAIQQRIFARPAPSRTYLRMIIIYLVYDIQPTRRWQQAPPRRTQQKCHNRRTPDTILCMTSRNIAFCCSNWPKMGSIGMRNRRSACVWDTCCHTQVVYLWHRIRQVIEMTAGSVSSVRERTHEKCRQPRARGLWDYYTI